MSSSFEGLIFNLCFFSISEFSLCCSKFNPTLFNVLKNKPTSMEKNIFFEPKIREKKIKSVSLRLFTGDKVVDVVIVDVVIGHRCRRHLCRRRHWRTFYLKFWSGLFFSREEKMIVVLKKQRRERDWCWKTRVSVICQRSCSRPPPFFHPRKKN